MMLLIAVILMAVVCVCMPIGLDGSEVVLHVYNFVPVFILGVVVAALLFVDIFLFKNLKLQMMVAAICVWLMVAFMALGAFMLMGSEPAVADTAWVWPSVLTVIALVVTVWARARMKADRDQLRSVDRLR